MAKKPTKNIKEKLVQPGYLDENLSEREHADSYEKEFAFQMYYSDHHFREAAALLARAKKELSETFYKKLISSELILSWMETFAMNNKQLDNLLHNRTRTNINGEKSA